MFHAPYVHQWKYLIDYLKGMDNTSRSRFTTLATYNTYPVHPVLYSVVGICTLILSLFYALTSAPSIRMSS